MSRIVRFGAFEVDLQLAEVRKQGRTIAVQKQPFEVLRILLEHSDELVTRETLRARLWPEGVVGDFDQSLNKSVTKLRDALGDSATHPRFIETVPRRGYRFVAPVEIDEAAKPAAAVEILAPPRSEPSPHLGDAPQVLKSRLPVLAIVVASSVALMPWWFIGGFWPMRQVAEATTPVSAPPSGAPQQNTEARDAYERGRIALTRRREEGFRSAVDLFERAIALDSTYAAAYVGLADAWTLLASYGMEQPRPALARGRELAHRALLLNPESAEAHASLGRSAMIGEWDWATAENHFKRALEIQGSYATAHQWYAYLLSATGRHVEAERAARRGVAVAPLSPNASTALGHVLYTGRRFDEAAAILVRVVQMDPDFAQARRNLGLIYTMQGRYSEAEGEFARVLQLTGGAPTAIAEAAWLQGRSGDTERARQLLKQLQHRQRADYVPPDSLALTLWAAGDRSAAIEQLQKAFDLRAPMLAHFAVDPLWDQPRELPAIRVIADQIRIGHPGAAAMKNTVSVTSAPLLRR